MVVLVVMLLVVNGWRDESRNGPPFACTSLLSRSSAACV